MSENGRSPPGAADPAEQWRRMVANAPISIWAVDQSLRVLFAEGGAMTGLGLSPADLVGRRIDEALPGQAERFSAIVPRIRAGETVTVNSEIGGRVLETRAFALRDDEGAARGMMGVSIDVTDRARVETALSRERELLAMTLASIGEGVITTDNAGLVTSINPVAERLTGWSAEDALGGDIERVYTLADNATGKRLDNPVRALLEERPQDRGVLPEKVLISRDGCDTRVEDSSTSLSPSDGEPRGAVLVFRDIGRRRSLEETIRRKEKIESIGVLAGGIAHDFNNVLMVMAGYLSIARRRAADNPEVSLCLAEAEGAVTRARDLTGQLLTFSRGGAPLKNVIDPRPVIDEAARFALSGTGRLCRCSLSPDTWQVEADPIQIGQVIQNLVQNAHQASAGGSPVEISVRNASLAESAQLPVEGERHVIIEVSDHGSGMTPEVASRVFEPYFTTREDGTGLGLATAFSIIERHAGHIDLESRPGEGSRFLVYLPAAALDERDGRGSLTPPAGMVRSLRGRVLLMDDEVEVVEVTARMLGELGFEVESTSDGETAIEAYRRMLEAGKPFEAAILDLKMAGGLGGCEVARRIRGMHRGARLLVSSGYSDDQVMAEWTTHGFDGVLAKPYDVDRLDRTLRRLLLPTVN